MSDKKQKATIEDSDGRLRVMGPLTFATVPSLANIVQSWAKSDKNEFAVDLSRVSHSDSAGLALLLQWMGDARVAGLRLKFINVPDQVEEFIHSNGLAGLLLD
jgi:phospholipid transport system transporter-binding protein